MPYAQRNHGFGGNAALFSSLNESLADLRIWTNQTHGLLSQVFAIWVISLDYFPPVSTFGWYSSVLQTIYLCILALIFSIYSLKSKLWRDLLCRRKLM